MTAPAVAVITIARNRPTRTADYGPAPEGHARAGRRIGLGATKRAARWTRQLRSGSTFQVDALELAALRAWLEANPGAAPDVKIRELPAAAPAELEAEAELQAPAPELEAPAPKPPRGRRSSTKAEDGGEG